MFPPLGAHTPTSRIFRINSFGTGSGFSRRIDRVVRMISNRSAVFGAAFRRGTFGHPFSPTKNRGAAHR
jgi:hypothetical protein